MASATASGLLATWSWVGFISGALEAWIADEAPERDLGRVYLRGEQADYVGSLVGVIASVAIATVALSLPLLVGGAMTVVLGVILLYAMPENRFRPSPRGGRSSLQQVRATARGGTRLVRARPVLLILLVVAVFSGMSEEGFDRLYAKHFLDGIGLPSLGALDPVVWFGVLNAGALVLSYLAAEVVGRRLNVGDAAVAARLLLVLNVLTIFGMLSFALAEMYRQAHLRRRATGALDRAITRDAGHEIERIEKKGLAGASFTGDRRQTRPGSTRSSRRWWRGWRRTCRPYWATRRSCAR